MKSMKDFEKRFNYCVEHRHKEFYPNGYGISIIPDVNNSELVEVAVLKGDENNCDYAMTLTSLTTSLKD